MVGCVPGYRIKERRVDQLRSCPQEEADCYVRLLRAYLKKDFTSLTMATFPSGY